MIRVKYIKKLLLITFLLLSIFMGMFYFLIYDNITEQSLSHVEIRYLPIGENKETSETTFQKYHLSRKERELLFESIKTEEENNIESNYIFSNREYKSDHRIDPAVTAFELRLVNDYGRAKSYEIYLTEEKKAYLKASDSLYKTEAPSFFFTHEGFHSYYIANYLPDIQVGESFILHEDVSGLSWRIQRYDGEWIENNIENLEAFHGDQKHSFNFPVDDESLNISYRKSPDKAHYSFFSLDNDEVYNGRLDNVKKTQRLTIPQVNGAYRYTLESKWNKEKTIHTEVFLDLQVSLPIRFDLNRTALEQDNIIEITAKHAAASKDIQVDGEIVEDLHWYPSDRGLKSIIATNYDTEPGNYELELVDLKNDIMHSYDIEVTPRNYKTQHLNIDPSIEAATRNERALQEQQEYFEPVFLNSSNEKYFEETFLLPTEGRLTTEFGEQRFVNDELTAYRHNGIDIAAPKGKDVLSTNHGKVVFAREMILMGNTIVIDHGQGIFSTYMHLEELSVEKEQWVNKEESIGTVGSTGFSTGPHLHFTISYYDRPLEPGYFIIGEPFIKEEHYQLQR